MRRTKLLTRIISFGIIFSMAFAVPAPKGSVVRAEEDQNDQNIVAEENAQEEEKEKTPEELQKEAEEARLALQNDPNHAHHLKWVYFMNESESAEGTIKYMCPECGKVWYFRPVPAYYAFQGDVARRIETAPEGARVNVKTSLFINFNYLVMDALAERPDVSLYVSFLDQEYKGNRVSFVIPAGEDTKALLDENGYAGFIFLGNKYGLTMEEPMMIAEDEDAEEEKVKEVDLAKEIDTGDKKSL